jgi:hypothetical protein
MKKSSGMRNYHRKNIFLCQFWKIFYDLRLGYYRSRIACHIRSCNTFGIAAERILASGQWILLNTTISVTAPNQVINAWKLKAYHRCTLNVRI